MEKKLVKYMTNFDLTDVLGFGKLLEVEEKDDFLEYMVDIVAAFCECDRAKRRKLLKLAKDVYKNNTEVDRQRHKHATMSISNDAATINEANNAASKT